MKCQTRGCSRVDPVLSPARMRTCTGTLQFLKFRHFANVGRCKEKCKVDKRTHPKSAKVMIIHIYVSKKTK